VMAIAIPRLAARRPMIRFPRTCAPAVI
jgi:hypothetical protein